MKISRRLLASLTFRPFSKTDYYGFSGVMSPVPMIAERDNILVIIDGVCAELYITDDEGVIDCVDQCDDICALPSETEINNRIAALKAELATLEQY